MTGDFVLFARKCLTATLYVLSGFAHATGDSYEPAGPLPTTAPSFSLTQFAGGHLGVVPPNFADAYLVLAWRVMNNKPLKAKDARRVTAVLADTWSYEVGTDAEGRSEWRDALSQLADPADQYPRIDQSRVARDDPGVDNTVDLSSYPNCTTEATRTAAKTLRARAAAYGNAGNNAWVALWVKGQNQVFSNCGGGFALPEEAPANAPTWFKQDRAYQRAAARFYAGRFTAAAHDFDLIAQDKTSPWAELAPYLSGRSLLRQASLTKDRSEAEIRMAEARERFEQLVRSGTERQRSLSEAMLRRIRAFADPSGLLADSARRIGEQDWGDGAELVLGDFLTLMRTVEQQREFPENGVRPWAQQDGGMTDWVADMALLTAIDREGPQHQADFPSPVDRIARAIAATACSRAEGSEFVQAWLLACFSGIVATPADVTGKTLAHALALKPSDPAYPTVRYHLYAMSVDALYKGDLASIGLLGGTQATDVRSSASELRKTLEGELTKRDSLWGIDGANALSLLRARLATNVHEVLQFSRVQSLDDPPKYAWHQEIARPPHGSATELLPYASDILSRGLTTETLAAASEDARLPEFERKGLRRTAWVRAAILDQQKVLDRLTPALASDYPEHESSLQAVRTARSLTDRRFELAFLLLADTRFNLLYDETDTGARPYDKFNGWHDLVAVKAPPGFFSHEEERVAREEMTHLRQLQDSTSFIGKALITGSSSHAKEDRLAPALAQVVGATQNNEFLQDQTVSKRAFQTLHRLFPNSPSAKATKYYY